ncbi:MAG: PQQ-dependent methanol/ethanol family dehydrogenase [Geminicoccaceae bacterium]
MAVARSGLLAAAGTAFLLASTAVPALAVTQDDLLNDQNTPEDILTYGMGYQGHRYSPLDAVNRETVGKLVPVWAQSFGGEKQRGQESQPIIHDGIMYVTASYSRMFAIDPRTGEEIWQYDARLPDGILPCCDVINRGAAIWGDKVYFGTLDAKLVALDAKTGKTVWRKEIGDYKAGYSYTAAPLIVDGKVIVGNSGGEFGVVGAVHAFDAETGEELWYRPTVEGHMGRINGEESTMTGTANETWPGETWQFGGGATWLGGTYDPETNLLYFGAGNPAPWNSWTRPGDNKWTSATLALNPEDGEIVWGYQTTPHDGWDFDGVNEFIPFDLEKDGEVIKAGAKADRNGFFFVLNRENGAFISATPFVNEITWAEGFDENGRPIYVEENRPKDPATVTEREPVFAAPAFLGAKNWMPMAYSERTGLFYVPANEWGMDIWNEPITYKKGAAYLGAGFNIKPLNEDYIGALRAIDPATGEIKFEVKNEAPLWGGVMTTAGGLAFYGTPEGYIKAINDETGEELWRFNTGSGVVSTPVTWEMDGEQYLTVVSGWGGAVPLWGGDVAQIVKDFNQGGMVWTFKLASFE